MLLTLIFASGLMAYETDQHTNRLVPVSDSMVVMDGKVNDAIELISGRWSKGENERAFAAAIYWELGGIYWVDKIERWASKTDQIDKYPQSRRHSIYRGMPLWVIRVNYLFGVGKTLRVNEVMVGSDKFGHFFSQGFKYYKRELRGWDYERVLARGAFAERWIFGQWTTGVYSNADLVANFEGMLFYKSLFQDDIIKGKGAIMSWRDGKPVQQRLFTWADHINDYWDEALNPSFNSKSLNKRLLARIRLLCGEFAKNPDAFVAKNDKFYQSKYRHIGMKENRGNRFDRVCRPVEELSLTE